MKRKIKFSPLVSIIFVILLMVPMYWILYSTSQYSSNELEKQLIKSKKNTMGLGKVAFNKYVAQLHTFFISIENNNEAYNAIIDNNENELKSILTDNYDLDANNFVDFVFVNIHTSGIQFDISSTLFDLGVMKEYFFDSSFHSDEELMIGYTIGQQNLVYIYKTIPMIHKQTGRKLGDITAGIILNNNQVIFEEIKKDPELVDIQIYVSKINILGDEKMYPGHLENISKTEVSLFADKLYAPFKLDFNGVEDIFIYLVYKTDSLNRLRTEYNQKIIFIFIMVFLLGGLFFLIFNKLVTGPLKNLVKYAKIKNHYSQSTIPDFGVIEEFHHLGEVYFDTFKKLSELNKGLEDEVEERTLEIKEKNDLLEDRLEELVVLQERMIAQERLTSMGLLLAGVSHELKNPLNIILNTSYILKDTIEGFDTTDTSKCRKDLVSIVEIVEILCRMSERSTKIIESMLIKSQIGDGMFEAKSLEEIIDFNLKLFLKSSQNFDLSQVKITKQYGNTSRVFVNEREVGQVIVNILQNASYALSHKMVEGESFRPALEIKTFEEEKYAVLSIKDNGIGIPKNYISKIFESFETTKVGGEGTGLGLSLSLDLLKKHEGKIEVDSQEGEYTIFRVYFPKNS